MSSMFKRPRYNRFAYRPRYYNPETEKFKERYEDAPSGGGPPGSRIRFQRASERQRRSLFQNWGRPEEKEAAAPSWQRNLIQLGSLSGTGFLAYLGYAGHLQLMFAAPGMIVLLVVYIHQSSQFR